MTRIVPAVQTKLDQGHPSLWLDEEYKPFSNEFSVSGTTYETMRSTTCGNKTVDPAMEMKEVPMILAWSAANLEISDLEGERSYFVNSKGEVSPSFHKHHAERPELQKGLFKPMKRPAIKRHLD
ncbi:hypothetical protein NQZ79_g2156 [Umbelopsis isabellina]|nr:hypothetical protein NQZ79_g2156 [Umbelopsis isabellina]